MTRWSQRAEQDPDRREALVAPVLGELGAWDLDPRGDADELEAAAALCRSAGYWADPVPGRRTAGPPGRPGRRTGWWWWPDRSPAAAVAGLDLRWAAVTLDGRRSIGDPRSRSAQPPRESRVRDRA